MAGQIAMKYLGAFALSFALVGCDRPSATVAKPEQPDVGRWVITPAGSEKDATYTGWNVWRLDTKTGTLDFCTDAQFNTVGTTPAHEMFTCTQPSKPSSN